MLSRSLGSNFNAGRAIGNENGMIEAIKGFLAESGRKEELVVFDHRKYSSLDEHIRLFQQARVMIGPHGGGFYNLLFCPSRTLSIEFFPNNRWDQHIALASFWIHTRAIDGKYYLLPITPYNGQHDMNVDIPAVVDILRKELV